MARVPERELVALPRNIQLYYTFRAIYDEIYSPFGLIKPKHEMEMVIAFQESAPFEEQSKHVPDRFRRVRDQKREPRPYFYNLSPQMAFKDENRLFVSQNQEWMQTRETLDQLKENLSSVIASHKELEGIISGGRQKRGPLSVDELGKAVQRRRAEYPKWRELIWESTFDLRERATLYWSPQFNTLYTYAWKVISLPRDVPVMIFNGSLLRDLRTVYAGFQDSSYLLYTRQREMQNLEREHSMAYMLDYLKGKIKTPNSAKPFLADENEESETGKENFMKVSGSSSNVVGNTSSLFGTSQIYGSLAL